VAQQLLGDKSDKVVIATCAALDANGVKAAGPQLLALVQNTKAPSKARIAALDALSKIGAAELPAALTAASSDADGSLKTEATKLHGQTDPSAAARQLIASFGPAQLAEKKQILVALGDNPSAEAGKGLAALMADFAKVPPAAQLELIEAAAKRPESKAAVAAYEAALPKTDKLAKYLPALAGGDAAAGEKLFKEHPVAACLRCHKVGGQGGDAGPVLDGLMSRKDRHYVLESIVDVNAAIADGFQMVVLTMKDGNAVAGFLKKENDTDVIIQVPGEAATKTYKKADIKQRDTAPSGMLPNLADLLSPRELRDIIEYVATLK
jgi:quinoprotein glucose dehydrogenase